MRRATITIPDELEEALESYRSGMEFPPSLAALMQAALGEYLRERGYGVRASGVRPSMYEDAPVVKGSRTASEIVSEDRR